MCTGNQSSIGNGIKIKIENKMGYHTRTAMNKEIVYNKQKK